MSAEALIIDGYVDEPACFGVPPYISPYIRTVAGVLHEHGYEPGYLTIDQLRRDPRALSAIPGDAVVVMIAGVTVPGKYLGGTPATLTEIRQIGSQIRAKTRLIGGPIGFGYAPQGGRHALKSAISGFDHLLTGSPAAALESYLRGRDPSGTLDYRLIDRWSVAGAAIIRKHPSYPHLMCEMETARGCSRALTGGCSFCTEPFYGTPAYRSVEGVGAEVTALHEHGALHFRLGRQPDILTYQAAGGEFPEPRPDRIRSLFSAVRRAAPGLRTLHIDNVNPGTIVHHPEKSVEVLGEIVRYHTPGDVAAFGMESADPAVIEANNLKATPDEVMEAISLVCRVGAARRDGIPELLPGLNFVIGLAGETEKTFDLNRDFLDRVRSSGLLVRRVNIRQLMPFEGTRAYSDNLLGVHDREFRAFKEYARTHFDLPMIRSVFPVGTVLSDVIIERSGDLSFGRQMGSYPVLVGIPLRMEPRSSIDAVVVDHGPRSVTALPVPVEVNHLSLAALKWIPGIGKKKAGKLAVKRPFSGIEDFRAVAGETPIDDLLSFSDLF